MIIKHFVIVISVLLAIGFNGQVEIRAQKSSVKENSCQQSAEEILSLIKSVYNFSPHPEKVLVAGEFKITNHVELPENPLTLTQVIAMFGGVLKTSNGSVYLIREFGGNNAKTKLEINLNDIKQGRVKDVFLEKGDVVFAPRVCSDGKILPPTKKPITLPFTNEPIRVLDKRVTG